MRRLTERLATAASLVRGGVCLADIGTDHAYLPVFLCEQGVIERAIASDIGEGPLQNAEKTVARHELEDRIELRLSDGLQNFTAGEAREIVICGMGGILISEILTAAPWVCDRSTHLVLQPMTHPQDVRRYLTQNGFYIDRELCVREGGRVYLCISAYWDGRKETKEEGFFYFGTLPKADDNARTFAERQYHAIRKRADALKNASTDPQEERLLREVLRYYERSVRE